VSRFEYHEPESLAEAIALASSATAPRRASRRHRSDRPDRRARVAPGTWWPARVPGLTSIGANGRIALGACVTHRAIERAAHSPARCALVEAPR
jgi:CO/xanthine dehydrogenase FAD-binding subunit